MPQHPGKLQRFRGSTLPEAISPDPQAGVAESDLAGVLNKFALSTLAKSNQELAIQAEQAGFDAAAGQITGEVPAGTTIAETAFRRGALLAHNAAIKTNIRDTIDRLELDNEANPTAFEAAVDGFQAGLLKEVPPLLRTEASIELADKRSTAGVRVLQRQRANIKEENLAQLIEGVDSLERESRIAARELNEARVDKLQNELFDLLDGGIELDILDADTVAKTKLNFVRQLDAHAVLGGFERVLFDGGLDEAEASLAAFKRVKGLDPQTKQAMLTQMTTLLNREHSLIARREARDRAVLVAKEKALKQASDDAVDVLNFGSIPEGIEELLVAAEGTTHHADLAEAMTRQRTVERFLLASEIAQATLTDKLRSRATQGTITAPEVRLILALEKAQANHAKALDADALSLAISQGIVDEPDPLDFSGPDTLAASITGRREVAGAAKEHYQRDVSPFTVPETEAFTRLLEDSSADEKTSLLAVLVDGLGADAVDVFETMDKKNNHFLALAGGLSLEGVPGVAREMLVGAEQIEANPKILPPDVDTANIISGYLGGFAANNPAHRAVIRRGALALYAARSARPTENGGKNPDFTGIIDADRLKGALDDVTGGIIRWRTSDFALRGVSEDEFENWIEDRLTSADIEAMGGVSGITSEGALTSLRLSGNLRAVSPGQFLVNWDSPQTGERAWMVKPDGEPFLLIFPGFEQGGPGRAQVPPPIKRQPPAAVPGLSREFRQ